MSLEACVVDFPDFTIQGQEIQLLVETSKNLTIVVTDPNGDACKVDIVDSGSRKFDPNFFTVTSGINIF